MTRDMEKRPARLAILNRPSAVLLAGVFVSLGLASSAIGGDRYAFSKGSFYQPSVSATAETQPLMMDGKSAGLGDPDRLATPKAPDLDPADVSAPDAGSADEAAHVPAREESTSGMAGLVDEGGVLDAGGGESGEILTGSIDQRAPREEVTASVTSKNNFGDSSFEPTNPQEAPAPSPPVRTDNRPSGDNFRENDFDRSAPVSKPRRETRNRIERSPPRRTQRRRQAKPRKRVQRRRRGQRQVRVRRKGWYCVATSSTGSSGWAVNRSRRSANRRALRECAIRTPRGRYCYSRGCRAIY